MNKNYYEILGVSSDASMDDIKTIYHKLVKVYHPDINHDSNASNKLIEINEAYEVLSDPTKRKEYDISLVDKAYTSKPQDTTKPNSEWYNDYKQEKLVLINNQINDLRLNSIKRVLSLFCLIMAILIIFYSFKQNIFYSIVIAYALYYIYVLSYASKPYMNIIRSIVIVILLSLLLVLVANIINIQIFLAIILIIYGLIPIYLSIIMVLVNISKINELKRELRFWES